MTGAIGDAAHVEQMMARILEHQQANRQQRDQALLTALGDIKAGIAAVSAAPKQPDPVPAWAKVMGALLALVLSLATVGGIFISYGRSDQATIARITALETSMETARRIRDQQQQAMLDRIRQGELADAATSDRTNAIMQTLAGITAQLQAQAARVEELLRRQDRLENRLGARPGSGPLDEQPTTLTLPLRWSPR
jgi:hypothetical protein